MITAAIRIQLVVDAERGGADRVEAHGDQHRRDADHDAGHRVGGEAASLST